LLVLLLVLALVLENSRNSRDDSSKAVKLVERQLGHARSMSSRSKSTSTSTTPTKPGPADLVPGAATPEKTGLYIRGMPETAGSRPRRVVVIAEDPLARSGLAMLLAGDPRLVVIEQLAARDDLAGAPADVGVWDLGAGTAGSDLAGGLGAGVPVICLLPDGDRASELISRGARGLLPRDVDGARLRAAAFAVAEGLLVFDDAFAGEVLERGGTPLVTAENLTPRELEVLELVAEGLSNKLIAVRLGISEHTAKFHVNAILTKLGVQSRTEAVVRAARLGLLSL
jgi:two-component system, NarL family, nitrate/nitrite response regulator NarL